ncbi:MAG: hypothetical protein JSR28_14230, partial [Proteobacteria bacterium]|nr:hypothetical protein [Pseudomonadota bacterium]
MPTSIIPDLPLPRPSTPNVTQPIRSSPTLGGPSYDPTYVIDLAADETIYATNLDRLFDPALMDFLRPTFDITNNGTIWLANYPGVNQYGGKWLALGTSRFINNGVVVHEIVGEIEFGASLTMFGTGDSTLTELVNTGSVFVLNETTTPMTATANVVVSYNRQLQVTNSGLIAVQAVNSAAVAFDFYNGGHLVNLAGGQILVEGNSATGVRSSGSMLPVAIENYGLIQVASLGQSPAVAVWIEAERVTNYTGGTIRGDIALYGSGWFTNSGLVEGAILGQVNDLLEITNHSGGAINGNIAMGDVADSIVNHGTITGAVSMGAGGDLVDNRGGGMINGIVDMGIGADTFHGGAGQDLVTGEAGNDTIYGYGGDDLLLGGFGNDYLDGGTGADGLFGEGGNDILVTRGADYAHGGDGNDEVRLGDYTFARADGGAGFDTLVLPGGARIFDLSATLTSGRLFDFEAIRLAGSQELVLRGGDVQGLSGGETELLVTLTASDKLDLVGNWVAGGSVIRGGTTYAAYSNAGSQVLVEGTGIIAILAAAPNGAMGLDAIAAGPAAPMPGTGGLSLTSPNLFVPGLEVREDTVIDAGDNWYTVGPGAALNSYVDGLTLTVDGTLYAYNDASARARAIEFINFENVVINGAVGAISTGPLSNPVPDYFPSTIEAANPIFDAFSVINNGLVEAVSQYGNAAAIGMGRFTAGMAGNQPGEPGTPDAFSAFAEVGDFENHGKVQVYSMAGCAFGTVGTIRFLNDTYALINVSGWRVAVGAIGTHDFVNRGTITASIDAGGPGHSWGIILLDGGYESPSFHVTNSGVISAEIAVSIQRTNQSWGTPPVSLILDNSGEILGSIRGGDGGDTILNTGLITGTVDLGSGNDRFDGSNGGGQGTILGGAGDDTLVGGSGQTLFDGGAGFDTMTGGAGADTFRGTTAEFGGDRITDFSALDTIQISDANAATFSFTRSGNILGFGGVTMQVDTLPGLNVGFRAAAAGGVELYALGAKALYDNSGDGRADLTW